jgi:uncharacterized protein
VRGLQARNVRGDTAGASHSRDTQDVRGLAGALGRVQDVKHVEVLGLTMEAGSRAPLVLLREHDAPRRVLPIFVGPFEATAIALALGDEPPRRPLTHDLMATLVETAHARVERVEVTELRDGTFFAELTVSGPIGERRVDSRPSDAIALAVRVDAPLYVAGAVLDEAGAVLAETRDEEAIDEEVARFRSALDAFDPARDDTGDADPPRNDPEDLGDSKPGSRPEEPPHSPGA